jgi:cysteine-rich repeat protein
MTREHIARPVATGAFVGQLAGFELPITYRDFQPENVASGGHPDFFFLGTKKAGSTTPTTICVPNSGGPSKGNDSTARCWGIMATNLSHGKPQPGTTTTCACQFSDWNIGNTNHIPGGYTQAANDSPLSNEAGAYVGGTAGTTVSVTGNAGVSSGTLTGYTSSNPGGPIWKGTTPAFKDANSFKQWFNDDKTVNTTFTAVLEMTSIGGNIYQYASQSHLTQGGFFPLDTLNPSQTTLCNLWPYWNRANGSPIWTTCTGDQYLFPPRIVAADAATCDPVVTNVADLTKGCWQDKLVGVKHGDGKVQTDYGEQCEPSGADDSSCTSACRLPGGCGDGKIEPPEQCDDGDLNNNGEYGGCAPSCIYAPHCGDGIMNGPEECDDGILDSSYGGCTPQCKRGPHCGDGFVNGPEECDDGDKNGKDTVCSTECKKIIYISY